MSSKRFFFRTLLVCGFLAGTLLAGEPVPSLTAGDLAKGPFSSMHMLLEKTVLKVDVLTVDVKVTKKTQDKFAQIATGKGYTPELGNQIADIAIKADDALVQLEFKRDVGLNMWIGEVRRNLQQARDAGLISPDLQQKVSDSLPSSFSALSERGYKNGDRLLYRVRPDSLRTVVVGPDHATVLLDRIDKDPGARRVPMACYFAPASDFRDLLLKSLFGS
ncbi:MAG: hypothetical protein JW751_26890 [Polyangiaceae bacterium]|nr:hypothetical protein [Polyangiaceae bacterium]